jgi:hypothetical protein
MSLPKSGALRPGNDLLTGGTLARLAVTMVRQEVSAWQSISRSSGPESGKVAGLVVAGVVALAAGTLPVWNWVPYRRQPRKDGSHEEDGEDEGQNGQES